MTNSLHDVAAYENGEKVRETDRQLLAALQELYVDAYRGRLGHGTAVDDDGWIKSTSEHSYYSAPLMVANERRVKNERHAAAAAERLVAAGIMEADGDVLVEHKAWDGRKVRLGRAAVRLVGDWRPTRDTAVEVARAVVERLTSWIGDAEKRAEVQRRAVSEAVDALANAPRHTDGDGLPDEMGDAIERVARLKRDLDGTLGDLNEFRRQLVVAERQLARAAGEEVTA